MCYVRPQPAARRGPCIVSLPDSCIPATKSATSSNNWSSWATPWKPCRCQAALVMMLDGESTYLSNYGGITLYWYVLVTGIGCSYSCRCCCCCCGWWCWCCVFQWVMQIGKRPGGVPFFYRLTALHILQTTTCNAITTAAATTANDEHILLKRYFLQTYPARWWKIGLFAHVCFPKWSLYFPIQLYIGKHKNPRKQTWTVHLHSRWKTMFCIRLVIVLHIVCRV